MKRSLHIFSLALICAIILLPVAARAETYNLGDTDMTIEVDDSRWYVFTRDNLENNSVLAEFGLSESEIYDDLCSLGAYMDAVWINSKGRLVELFVFKTPLSEDDPVNMSHYSDRELEEVAESMVAERESAECSIYENDYKFLKLDFFDEEGGYYIHRFLTVVNRELYALSFQSSTPFSDTQLEEFERIVDSIYFAVDTSMKEPRAQSSGWQEVLEHSIVGLIVGVFSVIIGAATNKKKKAAQNQQATNGYNQQGYNDYNRQNYYQPNDNGGYQTSDNSYYRPNDRQ